MRRIAIVMAAAVTLTACVFGPPFYWGEEIHGRVVDAGTGKPVAGAVVVADWKLYAGGYGHGGHADSLLIEETITNDDGQFQFRQWGPQRRPASEILQDAPWLTVFKRGYEHRALNNEVSSNSVVRKSDWVGKDIPLKQYNGSAAGRLDTIWLVLSLSGLQPLMLHELLAEQPRYTDWPSGASALFSHIELLLRRHGRVDAATY
jgi:hypothetical protein